MRADLLRRLDAGAFDNEFPGEMALVAEYQVSRETVRTALRELRVDGVVLAERGRRPRPAGPVITQPLGTLYSLFASVESAGLSQESIIRRRDLRADGVIADRLGLEADLALTGLYAELAARTGVQVDGGREHICTVVPTKAEQRLLAIPPSTGALLVSRLGYAAGRPVEWRRTLIRGDRFSLVAEFSSRTGYRLAPTAVIPCPRGRPARPPGTPSAAGPKLRWRFTYAFESSRDHR